MREYDHKKIETKWQKEWEKKKTYQAQNVSKKPKFYSLIEFPYPSGDGLHVGHPRPYIGMDVISRYKRMKGFNVLYPIGWDAFGLPTENYAIKTGLDPRVVTKKNSDNFRRQIKSIGISFDWSREINTTDPKYYKWTQWIFLQFLKKGLAYKKKMLVNWCPKDKTGLANEEVVAGACERCGTMVEKREKEQWMLAITKYADRLDKDLDKVDYLPNIKLSQRNWIGRSLGAEIDFKISGSSSVVKVFTTRPDTIYGATYLVLAPEHEVLLELKPKISNWDKVSMYILESKAKNDIDRTKEEKDKTGVELKGVEAVNPATGEKIPIWIADYVLAGYGTGAIMAVPAHDERDFDFAKKHGLPIKQVVMPKMTDANNPHRPGKEYTKRNVVQVILRNKKNEALIHFLKDEKWKGLNPKTFIIGGIEEGENEQEAAEREIKEETGYVNFKFVEKIPFEFQSNFFAAHKDVNRTVHVKTLVFDLLNEEKVEITEDEYFNKNSQETKWIPSDKVEETVSTEDQKMTWRFFEKGGFNYDGEGILINSGRFDGLDSELAKNQIINFVDGKEKVSFKLRDWIFSRQRYWGEPIPVVFCDKCGIVPVPDKDLPVELPKVKNYQPTESGESPLANVFKWVNTKCPKCKGRARRETDTMPNWAGSSWYYLRYTDHKNSKSFADKKNLKYWTPVDWYNGGNEHTTLHLLYSRFWHKFLYDLDLVPTIEPYMKRTSHGMILGGGGVKMSKSLGNVINPDDVVKTFGADTLRLYEMFMGPFDQKIAWSDEAIVGPRRFLEKVWKISYKLQKNSAHSSLLGVPSGSHVDQNFSGVFQELNKNSLAGRFQPVAGGMAKNFYLVLLHKTIKKVEEDIMSMRFNTAISSMMILATEMEKSQYVDKEDFKKFLQILAPFAPHIAEELWNELGEKKSINLSTWPAWNPDLLKDEEVKIVIQVNGKVRAEILVPSDALEEDIKNKAIADPMVLKYTKGEKPSKIIYIKNKLINIVI